MSVPVHGLRAAVVTWGHPPDGDDDDGDDPGDPGERQGRRSGRGSRTGGGGGADHPGSGGAGKPSKREAPPGAQEAQDKCTMLRQWILACLEKYAYITVAVPADDGDGSGEVFKPMQILNLEPRGIYLQTWETWLDGQSRQQMVHGAMTVDAQPFEVWEPSAACQTAATAARFDAFILEDPAKLDLLSLTGVEPAARRRIQKWKASDNSEVDGCLVFTSPELPAPVVDIASDNYPVLCLLDALHDKGWTGKPARVVHRRRGAKLYDCRRPPTKAIYYKCLLKLAELWKLGADEFPSDECQASGIRMRETIFKQS